MSELRDQSHCVIHQVWSRCLGYKLYMHDKRFRRLFIKVLGMAENKYEFDLLSYQILSNHFHMMIRTHGGDVTISRILQYIKSVFARMANKELGRFGPFWNERFKNRIIENYKAPKETFLKKLWYGALNPVRAGEVTDPRDAEFSSINAYLDSQYNSIVKITMHEYYLSLGNSHEERVEAFLQYENAYL